jgi:hypothetical protein
MKVSAIIVSRGNVDLRPVLGSLPEEWEQVVWNNSGASDGGATVAVRSPGRSRRGSFDRCDDVGADLSVYGRYAAIEHASGDVIFCQDDDCIVSDPRAIVDEYVALAPIATAHPVSVVCNMPEPWRSNPFYTEHALVGFGAAFHRDAPARAFARYWESTAKRREAIMAGHMPSPTMLAAMREAENPARWPEHFLRTCDVVFTALTPRVLVDIPHESFDYAWDADRMWRQPDHQGERERMLDLVLQVARAR